MYETNLKPTSPLEEGGRVRLIALPRITTPIPMAAIERYQPYEPHVCGEVIRIAELGSVWARATIINECAGNRVGVIDLDLPNAPGITTWRTAAEGGAEAPGWIGEAPERGREWEENGGVGRCKGKACSLGHDGDKGEGSFRAIPQKRKGQTSEGIPLTVNEEGASTLHLWLKYEGYD
ncbi:hypothetical protein K466DRAFT_566841 [Polyporus arcularius HHB13444]|uniref:Uncharacterized protein n=1 Tax=Polyporus arcularius HHB13444 TaxID=1314778 RepID=A0A5C3P5Y5_9APHY|nr:hypothetical protein K466DRAFT_566841 [Polyporus arcularius HHB13444]